MIQIGRGTAAGIAAASAAFVWHEVLNSTVIMMIGYNFNTRTMRLIFRSGAVYDYANVDALLVLELIEAQSVGSLFNRFIRGDFPYQRVL